LGFGLFLHSHSVYHSKQKTSFLERFKTLRWLKKNQCENESESECWVLAFFFILILFIILNKKLRVFVPSCLRVSSLRLKKMSEGNLQPFERIEPFEYFLFHAKGAK